MTVASPGTAVAVVASGNAVSAVSFRARADNTGAVYVGDSGFDSSDGYRLEPGDELNLSSGRRSICAGSSSMLTLLMMVLISQELQLESFRIGAPSKHTDRAA